MFFSGQVSLQRMGRLQSRNSFYNFRKYSKQRLRFTWQHLTVRVVMY